MINKNQVYRAFYETIASGATGMYYVKGVLDVSKKLLSVLNQSKGTETATIVPDSHKNEVPELYV